MPEILVSPPRLFIIPVGDRLLGLWAPLLALKPTNEDCIVLLVSEQVKKKKKDATLAEFIKEKAGIDCVSVDLEAYTWEKLSDAIPGSFDPQGKPVMAISNGCWAPQLPRFIQDSIAFAEISGGELRFVVSRDEHVMLLDRNAEVRGRHIADIEVADALELLGLRHDNGQRRIENLGQRGHCLENVGAVAVRASQLVARFDLSKLDKSAALTFHKKTIHGWNTLGDFGLDTRSVFCVIEDSKRKRARWVEHLVNRLVQDRIGFGNEKGWNKWLQTVSGGSSTKKAKNWIRTRSSEGAWTNPETVILALGTQASTTLQSLWGHRAAHAVLVADEDCFENAKTLADKLPSQQVTVVKFVRGISNTALDEMIRETQCRINATPGDRLVQTTLILLALKHQRDIWLLNGNQVETTAKPGGGKQEVRCDAVPPRLRLAQQALDVDFAVRDEFASFDCYTDPMDDILRCAKLFKNELSAGRPNLSWLNNLQRRKPKEGNIQQDRGRWNFHIGGHQWKIPSAFKGYFVPMVEHLGTDPVNGRWLELFAGALILEHVDQVLIGVEYREAITSGANARDELDVVAARGARLILFSCKTGQGEEGDFATARAQVDRFLGREGTVVLLVPRLTNSTCRGEYSFIPYPKVSPPIDGLYVEEKGLGFLADMRCLTAAGVDALYGFRRSRV